MKTPLLKEIEPNQVFTSQFLVLHKEVRQKKTGEPFLSLQLGDRSGDIDAKMWDNVVEVVDAFEKDDFVKIKGVIQVYQNRPQLTVHKLRLLTESEVDLADYFPSSLRDQEEMFAELKQFIGGIENVHLKALLEAIFQDEKIAGLYKKAPAAKSIHHAYLGGLIEHVLSLCALCRIVAPHYKTIDLDLLLTGAILHDIGKIEELTYDRGFGYSSDGQLLGHIIIGLRMVDDKLRTIPDFPPKLRSLLEHMIISHHGELEFGSPKVPLFPEALLLHYLDNLDSKMECMRVSVERDRQIKEPFTGWISSLERVVLKKTKYLEEITETAEVAVPVPTNLNGEAPYPQAAVDPEPPAIPAIKPAAAAPPKPSPPPPPPKQQPLGILGEKLQAVLGKDR